MCYQPCSIPKRSCNKPPSHLVSMADIWFEAQHFVLQELENLLQEVNLDHHQSTAAKGCEGNEQEPPLADRNHSASERHGSW